MKWMIASDIHGSESCCRQMLARYRAEGAERLFLLGDLLYHGPRNDLPPGYAPKAVAGLLNAHAEEILCVRGNCEAEVDQMMLHFPVMAEYALLPLGRRLVYITHGHHASPDCPPPLKAGDILLSGHTHVPACVDSGRFVCLNPGSVAIPKEGSCHSYMTLEGETFLWKNLQDGETYMEWKA